MRLKKTEDAFDDLDDIQVVGEDIEEAEVEEVIAPPEEPNFEMDPQGVEFIEDVPGPPEVYDEVEDEVERHGTMGFDVGWDEEEQEEEGTGFEADVVRELTEEIERIREDVGSAPTFLDISEVESLLKMAEAKHQESDYPGAQELVQKSARKLDALRKDYEEASKRFEKAKKMLKKANKLGVKIGVGKELLKEAKERLDAGELEEMKELSGRCIEELEREMLEPITREKMLALKAKILQYKGKGVDIKSAAEVFNTAGILMKERNFKQVLNLAEKSEAMAEKGKKQFDLANSLSTIEKGIDQMKDTNPEIAEIGEDVDKVRSLQKEGELTKAHDLTLKIEGRFREILEPVVNGQLKELDVKIEESEHAIYINEEKEERQLAIDALDKGDFLDAFNHITTALKSIDETKKNSYPLITLRFVDGELKENVWNRAKVILKNTGKAHAKGIKVELIGPVVVRRLRPVAQLNAKEERGIEIAVKFDGGGSVPVDVEMTYKSAIDGNEHESRDGLWIEVGHVLHKGKKAETAGGREPSVISPGKSTRCKICLGVIKGHSKLYECGCGRTYHTSCIRRTLECPSCGLQFQD